MWTPVSVEASRLLVEALNFPDLTREDIRACLAFAADRERKFASVPPA